MRLRLYTKDTKGDEPINTAGEADIAAMRSGVGAETYYGTCVDLFRYCCVCIFDIQLRPILREVVERRRGPWWHDLRAT